MLFKTPRIAAEFQEILSGKRGPLLLPVLLTFDSISRDVSGRDALLTEILRTPDEHRNILEQINRKRIADGLDPKPLYATVHSDWRGADGRTNHYSEPEASEICDRLNSTFHYIGNDGRARLVAFRHQGTSAHVHLQVPRGVAWTIER